ncbi:unnamed protein product [Medioppia subpectinata]|uniref:choline-phosphate cytidylyltransferase n=1 Tax=Medioppia subpectinata TaxID=1979941 RepID=A0A7R9PTY4_9ACAR|nr:unnamed protein product [Medioppia subpectinata]CAG2101145.1 unnamed protein product [Medioppia subpectinata]
MGGQLISNFMMTAGKVRAQTPKTPKMEKARKKTGRAALRIKFARRSETDYFAAKGKLSEGFLFSQKLLDFRIPPIRTASLLFPKIIFSYLPMARKKQNKLSKKQNINSALPTPNKVASKPDLDKDALLKEELEVSSKQANEMFTEEYPIYPERGTFEYTFTRADQKYKIPSNRPVRIYCDGVYDLFHYGHARQLKQAKNLFKNVHLLVGVANDEDTQSLKGVTVMNEKERYESVRHCGYVDEVIEGCPWVITDDFLIENRIDFVAHDDIPYKSATSDDIYQSLKHKKMFIPTMRTDGISTTGLITRIIKDYEIFLRRQILKGISCKELNISFLKESRVKIKNKINSEFQKVNNDIKELSDKVNTEILGIASEIKMAIKYWEEKSNIRRW